VYGNIDNSWSITLRSYGQAYKDTYLCFLGLILQTVVLFGIVVMVDLKKTNSFKGNDARLKTVERTQLPESDDVVTHRLNVEKDWDKSGE
jgi:hypothetical protein